MILGTTERLCYVFLNDRFSTCQW